METFKLIPNFPNYEISNLGNVRNVTTTKTRNPSFDSSGYKQIDLRYNKTRKTFKIHRLIAMAFIPNVGNKECIDHIDNNRTNNNIDNLRWATRSENSQNKNVQSNNTSGCTGVSFDHVNKKWRVKVIKNRVHYDLGYFLSFDDAKKARIQKVNELFQEFTPTHQKIKII